MKILSIRICPLILIQVMGTSYLRMSAGMDDYARAIHVHSTELNNMKTELHRNNRESSGISVQNSVQLKAISDHCFIIRIE